MPSGHLREGSEQIPQGLVLLLLVLLPLATFYPVLRSEFVSYDDFDYVSHNPTVLRGLTWAGVRWAFTTKHAGNWHPLTWLSHMADASLFGPNPAGHHATNLVLHIANTLLLFLLFRSLTSETWRSAWVAALFAVHPAHVESVAWVAERKDLLCAGFWLATTWAYVSWVRRRGGGRYLLVLLFFAAGLMSKPMIVSLPLVLLLLDYWPLGRFRARGTAALLRRAPNGSPGLILEKVPLFLLAATSSAVTFLVQRAWGAVGSLQVFPLWARAGNAVVAYVRYIGMLFWPTHLAVLYPHPGTTLSFESILASAILVLLLTAAAVALRRPAPFLFVGWLWFLVTLLPVIGVVQVGLQALADRYTYIPFVGLFVAIAWGVPAIVSGRRSRRLALHTAAAVAVIALSLAAAVQARVWKNTGTLFLNALKNTKDNGVAYKVLGEYYNSLAQPDEALKYLNVALRIHWDKAAVHDSIGMSLFSVGQLDQAWQEFSEAVRLKPNLAVAWNNLARTQFAWGEVPEAIKLFNRAISLAPEMARVRGRLALALLMEGETAAADSQMQNVIALYPSDAESVRLLSDIRVYERTPGDPSLGEFHKMLAKAHLDASTALYRRGKKDAAAEYMRRAFEVLPDFAEAYNELGSRLVRERRLDEAVTAFRQALSIHPDFAAAHNNLGYAFFLKGSREVAIDQYREALRLQSDFPLARSNLDVALRGKSSDSGQGQAK